MAYDGFYAGLSSRASVNEILNLAIATKEELLPIAAAMESAEATTLTALGSIEWSKGQAATSAAASAASAQASEASSVKAKQYADSATYKFQTLNTAALAVPIGQTTVWGIVTTNFPAVFYQTKVTLSGVTGDVLYDVQAYVGTTLVYRAEALTSPLVDSLPFFSEATGPMYVYITNRGRTAFNAAITSTLSQVGNL